jgi:hypothetical protein
LRKRELVQQKSVVHEWLEFEAEAGRLRLQDEGLLGSR